MRLGTVHPEVSHIPGCERGLRTPYNCRRLLSSAVPEVEVPDTLALPAELRPGYTLFAWQDRAYRWLKNRKGALLIHSAGAGKTYTAICAALHHGGPVVWVTKATLKRQVYREVRQRSFVDPLVLEGETPHLIPEGTRMVIVNYDVLHAWRKVLTEFVRGGVFVGDELHTAKASKRYTKTVDPETGRIIYDTLWNVSSCTAAIAEAAAKRIGLTATPQPNSREDLWSQLDIIEPGCWGNWWNFVHRYCNPPEAPIWMGDYTFKPIGDVVVGDEVIGWHRPGQRNKLVRTKVTHVARRQAPIVKVTLASGRVIRCTADHQWLNFDDMSQYRPATVGKNLVRVVDSCENIVLTGNDAYAAGWLAGMYDGEGCNAYIAQSSAKNPGTTSEIADRLTQLGIPYTMVTDSPTRGAGGAFITGGRNGLLKFLRTCRPVRYRSADRTVLTGRFATADTVMSIEPDGFGEVVSLTTESGNYVAWGYASKNCAAKPGKHGGIDASGESNTEELKARLREVMHTVRKSELLAELPPMRRELLYISVEEQCRPSGGMAAEMKAAAKAGAMSLLEAKFAESSARKRNWVEKFVQDILDQGLKVCIMTGRRIDVEALQRTLEKPAKKAGVPLWAIHGGHPLDMRDSAVLAYMGTQGKGALLIGTGECLGTGTNLQDTDVALFVMLPYTPGGIVQWEGRFSRPGQTRAVRIIYAIAQGTVDETVCDILLDKLESVEKTTDDPEAGSVARLLGGADDEKILQQLLNNI